MIKAILILLGLAGAGTVLLMALLYLLDLVFCSTRYVSLDDLEERIKKFNRETREAMGTTGSQTLRMRYSQVRKEMRKEGG